MAFLNARALNHQWVRPKLRPAPRFAIARADRRRSPAREVPRACAPACEIRERLEPTARESGKGPTLVPLASPATIASRSASSLRRRSSSRSLMSRRASRITSALRWRSSGRHRGVVGEADLRNAALEGPPRVRLRLPARMVAERGVHVIVGNHRRFPKAS